MNFIQKIKQHKNLWKDNTPCFFYDKSVIVKNLNKFNSLFNGEIAYSLKTNSEKEVIKTIHLNKNNFSVCSIEELEILKRIIKDISKVIYYSPSLDKEEMAKILNLGIKRLSIDSEEQVNLIINEDRLKEVFLRISTESKINNENFVYGKDSFLGIPLDDSLKHIEKLSKKFKFGLHNHLTSQNNSLDSWEKNLDILFKFIKDKKIKPNSINLGGGFPISYNKDAIPLETISKIISEFKKKIKNIHPEINFIFEPGRVIIGNAVSLITKIKQIKKFGDKNVLIVDSSVYTVYLDTLIVNILLPPTTFKKQRKTTYSIRGKSPDSRDFFIKDILLPEMKIGEHIVFMNAGAYNFYSDFLHYKKPNIMVVN